MSIRFLPIGFLPKQKPIDDYDYPRIAIIPIFLPEVEGQSMVLLISLTPPTQLVSDRRFIYSEV